MGFFQELSTISTELRLRFLIIGGHAVNLHGYSRVTQDIDLLVCRDELAEWKKALERLGYSLSMKRQPFCG